MCSGGNRKAKAKKKAKTQKKKAERRQRELDRIAREREQIARQNAQRSRQLQNQQQAMVAAQKNQVAALKAQQGNKLKGMKSKSDAEQAAILEASNKKVKGIQLAGGAAATSLRILGQTQPKAPTAQRTPRNAGRRGAGTTAAEVARGSAQNRGFNLSI